MELRDKIYWPSTSINGLEVSIRKVQKKNFPDLKRKTYLFWMQSLQPRESHSNSSGNELAVEFSGLGTRIESLLTTGLS